MHITAATQHDFSRLTQIWEAAVRATHYFLVEDDILRYRRLVHDIYLAHVELAIARSEDGTILGFMGVTPPSSPSTFTKGAPAKVEMLFIDPEHHQKGVGTALLQHAAKKYGTLDVDVNEQNPGGVAFYKKSGFTQTGRSALDSEGKPFPLLHFRKTLPSP